MRPFLPHALVVLCGGLKKDASGHWRTTNFDEGDEFAAIGDRLRVLAAHVLYQAKAGQIIIASGGRGQLSAVADAPPAARVLTEELVGLGVPAADIIEESESGTTYEQLVALKKIVTEHPVAGIAIISNRWHLPRITAMFERFPEFAELKKIVSLELIAAENVLMVNNRAVWEPIITKAYSSEAIKKRIALEERGIEDIKQGTYVVRKNNF